MSFIPRTAQSISDVYFKIYENPSISPSQLFIYTAAGFPKPITELTGRVPTEFYLLVNVENQNTGNPLKPDASEALNEAIVTTQSNGKTLDENIRTSFVAAYNAHRQALTEVATHHGNYYRARG